MRRSETKKAYSCSRCKHLNATGCAGGEPKYYCTRLLQLIARPANTGCSYCEEVEHAE